MNRLIGLLLVLSLCFFWSCQKELSYETGGGPSSGSLQSDVTGDCLPKTVTGTYEAGKALIGDSNYIQVQVNVVETGTYVVTTDTVNGMHFVASGVFTTPGLITIKLKGNGTPVSDGISNFVVTYDSTVCNVAVTVLPNGGAVPAVFTFEGAPGACMNYMVSGTYVVGTPLDPLTNTVAITVNVTTAGTYSITTAASNNMTFTASGTLATGTQTITLSGTGTPASTGDSNIPVTTTGSNCGFIITVTGPAVYTVNCASATINGTYEERTALAGANTIVVPVNVTSPGSYTISGTINGMTFTATGSFSATGAQNVTLNGTGTPTNPGTSSLPIMANGTAACNISITVTPVDYYPRTAASNWSYEFDADPTDSLFVRAKAGTVTLGGQNYTEFEATNDAAGGFGTFGRFRKMVGEYHAYRDMGAYFGFTNTINMDYIFLKDDVPVNTSWQTANIDGTSPSGNLTLRIVFTVIQKGGSITIGATTYNNVIVVTEKYQGLASNGSWVDFVNLYYKTYYSKNIGMIKEEEFSDPTTSPPNPNPPMTYSEDIRRYQVN